MTIASIHTQRTTATPDCPAWCVNQDPDEHTCYGDQRLYMERDENGAGIFAITFRPTRIATATMIDLRAWQAGEDGAPNSELEDLLTLPEAHQLAKILNAAIEDAENTEPNGRTA